MNQEQWTAVDEYFDRHLLPPDPALEAALRSSTEAGLPGIHVAPNQGWFLQLLARSLGARAILEIGTLGGYSTIWMARALPEDGRLITLEADAKHAAVASANVARAGLTGRVEIRVGPALDTLPRLESEGQGPFDLVFIDADKESIPEYLGWSLRLTRPGSLVIVDNVVRRGAVLDEASQDPGVRGVRRMAELLAAEPRLDAAVLQTVGTKGWDGLAIARVVA